MPLKDILQTMFLICSKELSEVFYLPERTDFIWDITQWYVAVNCKDAHIENSSTSWKWSAWFLVILTQTLIIWFTIVFKLLCVMCVTINQSIFFYSTIKSWTVPIHVIFKIYFNYIKSMSQSETTVYFSKYFYVVSVELWHICYYIYVKFTWLEIVLTCFNIQSFQMFYLTFLLVKMIFSYQNCLHLKPRHFCSSFFPLIVDLFLNYFIAIY